MNTHTPTVSIGIPVYNSEKYLERTLQSIINQGFKDFQIVISDNASTDSTQEICRRYVREDTRIKYHRSDVNRGPGWNYNRVLDLADGKYFKWQACDDLLEADFLEKCVEVLDHQSNVILCHCHSVQIDDQDRLIHSSSCSLETNHHQRSRRLRSLLMQGKHVGCEIFGLIRMSTLRSMPQQGSYAHADFLFLCHLAFYGRFYQIPEALFQYRIHAEQSMQVSPTHFGKRRRRLVPFSGPLPPTDWWNPSKKGQVDFPTWRLYWILFGFVRDDSMPIVEKIKCYSAIFARLFKGKDIVRLGIDVLIAIETSLQRFPASPQPIVDSPNRTRSKQTIR